MPELDEDTSEDEAIRKRHVQFLTELGVSPIIALEFADVDPHDVARLIRRGCPPDIAVDIIR